MNFGIQGLDKLQRQLSEASKAFKELDGEIATLRFDPDDQSSVEAAIADMERAIDSKATPYATNPLVSSTVAQMKSKYRERILERATEAREQAVAAGQNSQTPDQELFRQIENTVTDLRHADSNSFVRHIKKLSRLLHEPAIEAISQALTSSVDIETLLKAGHATQGGMVGDARLPWPSDQKEELGFVISMIDRFAVEDRNQEAMNFAHTFYYNGNSITSNLQHMVAQMIVPFTRDYIGYVKSATGVQEATLLAPRSEPAARKAFVVHGHDDGSREAVARFLEKIEFQPIILHEQANQGQTIIEKIERHGDVGFAVILLTPDDEGCAKGGKPQPRARQNVLLELGYFIGRLTRSRVCALRRGDVEIPSDFGGVVYTPYDENGGWKVALGRELEAAGFEMDWNLVHKA